VVVDWRIRRFEAFAKDAFAFLADDGVTASEHDLGNPPSRIVVRFEDGTFVVESELIATGGTRTVTTFVRTVEGGHLIGPATAREDQEIADVLKKHADELRAVLDS
jgi:hypothetical protein